MIAQTSIPEFLLRPLLYLPWFKGQDVKQTHHHEHMTTGWLVGLLCAVVNRWNFWVALTIFAGAIAYHVFFKELWLDRHKNTGNPGQCNVDLTTRAWGMIHALLWLLS